MQIQSLLLLSVVSLTVAYQPQFNAWPVFTGWPGFGMMGFYGRRHPGLHFLTSTARPATTLSSIKSDVITTIPPTTASSPTTSTPTTPAAIATSPATKIIKQQKLGNPLEAILLPTETTSAEEKTTRLVEKDNTVKREVDPLQGNPHPIRIAVNAKITEVKKAQGPPDVSATISPSPATP